jgi:PAS domain S-box-containing protein
VAKDQSRFTLPTRHIDGASRADIEQALAAAEGAWNETTRLTQELDATSLLLKETFRELDQARRELDLRDETIAELSRQLEECVPEQRYAGAAVHTSESRLAAIFAQAAVGLSEIAPDGQFRMANDQLCAMLGRSREELLKLNIQDVTHPDDLARNLPLFVRLIETGEVFSIEKRYVRPDGSHFWAISSVSRIIGPGGEALGVIAATVDLTERREAELKLRETRDEAIKARAEAEQASRAKSRFLASVSHDLRQPVTSANLFLDLLKRRPLGPKERELVEPLASSIDSLIGMLNGLLQVARLDAGIVIADPREFPLDELLQRLFDEFQRPAQAAGLRFHIPPVHLRVRSDPLLLELILRNLISNAIKYTPEGSVLVLTRAGDGHVVLDVTDTGLGIAAEHRDLIFNEFYQGSETARDHSRGFGIGLATARRVAALLGIRIGVKSEVGRGSTFSVVLPQAESGEVMSVYPTDDGIEGLAGHSVLVADDEPLVLRGLEVMLSSWDMQVHAVRTLAQAKALLKTLDRPPDVVIADYSLAYGEKGTDVVAAARLHGTVAAILLTGDTSPDRLADAERSGCRLLHKPVNADTLGAVLKEVCLKP